MNKNEKYVKMILCLILHVDIKPFKCWSPMYVLGTVEPKKISPLSVDLTHWGRDKMTAIL